MAIEDLKRSISKSELTKSTPRALRPPQTDFSELRAIDNAVIYAWIDELEDEFVLQSGIAIARTLDRTRPRWGKVVAVGPESLVKVGQYVLPENTHDCFGAVYNGLELWKTYDEWVVLASSDPKITQTMNGD